MSDTTIVEKPSASVGKSVKISCVSKKFGAHEVLNNINIEVESGEYVTILGASGCGKTTLLKIIAGFEEPTQGAIYIDGENITERECWLRNIGVLFQNYALFPHMTVRQNISYPLMVRKESKSSITQKVNNIIRLVGLEDLSDRYPIQLSGGQQQRVALARAVVFSPSILLLDEPFSALDLKLRHSMQLEVKNIQKKLGITTISVTHDQEEAMTMSDRICIIKDGIVQQFDSPTEIYTHPCNAYVADFMGSINLFDCELIKKSQENGHYVYELRSVFCEYNYTIETTVNYPYFEGDRNLCKLAIRPEQLSFAVDKSECNENTFCARIKSIIYLGDRVRIDLIVGDDLCLIMKVANTQVHQYEIGSVAQVSFPRDGLCLLFE